jgi:hypothetical protein
VTQAERIQNILDEARALGSTTMSRAHLQVVNKVPPRIHFIPEWAAELGKSRYDIIEATGADKSVVSRWFAGTLPKEGYLMQLVDLFGLDDIGALFRHPKDEWLCRALRGATPDQKGTIYKLVRSVLHTGETTPPPDAPLR